MFKDNKGITMLVLVITIIILLIIAAVAIRSSSPLVEEAKLEDVRTDLLLIQAKWKIEREKVTFDGTSMFPENQIVSAEAATETDKKGYLIEKVETLPEGCTAEEGVTYYKLSQECLNAIGLEKIDANDNYIVNYKNNDIIYGKGFIYRSNDEEKTYYKLSEINELYE